MDYPRLMADLPLAAAAQPKVGGKHCAGCTCPPAEAASATDAAADELLSSRVLALSQRVREQRVSGLEERSQLLLADVLLTLDDLRLVPDAVIQLDRAEHAISELLSPTPNLLLAERLTQQLVRRVGGPMVRRLRKALLLTLPQVAVVLGLLGSLLIFGPSGYLMTLLSERLLAGQGLVSGKDFMGIIWVGLVGAHGSALSIVVRLRDFSKRQPPLMAFFTGLFKPFIGMSFAQLSYSLLKSGLLPLSVPPSMWLYITVGFLAGFSERLAKDLVAIGEQAGLRGYHPAASRAVKEPD